jgi:hypothetical protein
MELKIYLDWAAVRNQDGHQGMGAVGISCEAEDCRRGVQPTVRMGIRQAHHDNHRKGDKNKESQKSPDFAITKFHRPYLSMRSGAVTDAIAPFEDRDM